MKKSSLLVFFILISFAAFTQKNVVHIEYKTQVKVDGWRVLDSVEKEEPEYQEPDLEKKDNNVLFKTQLEKLGKKTTENYVDLVRHYYVGDSLIRLDKSTDKMSENEWVFISPKTGKMITYYTNHESKPTYSETELRTFPDSSLVYQIDTFHNDTKKILGYKCHKITITESRKISAEETELIKKYEMYITEELPLAAHVVIGMWQVPISGCALEIRESIPEQPSTFILTEAVQINEKQKNKLLELPEQYRNASKKSYLSDW